MLADAEPLLGRVKAGDANALELLMRASRKYLRQVVEFRMPSELRRRVDESDIVQETLAETFSRIDDFVERKPMPFHIWLRRNAQERLVMSQREHFRTLKRSLNREVPLPDHSSILLVRSLSRRGPDPGDRLENSESMEIVRKAFAKLAHEDQEIVLMRQAEGLSNHEVAQILNIPPKTASKRFTRALIRLRGHTRQLGLTGTGP
ncbi:ECF RNA polymerase sigma-E factor [Planctomycetes bacterium Pan216]|uniref:ECF RNA polymerase sigma-E factor n=2 Tax=Kolteria novifilia TaxID=2527975 RepID=A0A518B3V2_9BACT|nr:ECF RNA polymerase sigma-E factor [Planctomycetes bacterium Pan216]